MQEWYGVGKISSEKIATGTRQNKKPQNDEMTGRDYGKTRNETMA
jgi:hypothetical protein